MSQPQVSVQVIGERESVVLSSERAPRLVVPWLDLESGSWEGGIPYTLETHSPDQASEEVVFCWWHQVDENYMPITGSPLCPGPPAVCCGCDSIRKPPVCQSMALLRLDVLQRTKSLCDAADCSGHKHGLWRQNAWIQVLPLPYFSCVTLRKASNRFASLI